MEKEFVDTSCLLNANRIITLTDFETGNTQSYNMKDFVQLIKPRGIIEPYFEDMEDDE